MYIINSQNNRSKAPVVLTSTLSSSTVSSVTRCTKRRSHPRFSVCGTQVSAAVPNHERAVAVCAIAFWYTHVIVWFFVRPTAISLLPIGRGSVFCPSISIEPTGFCRCIATPFTTLKLAGRLRDVQIAIFQMSAQPEAGPKNERDMPADNSSRSQPLVRAERQRPASVRFHDV